MKNEQKQNKKCFVYLRDDNPDRDVDFRLLRQFDYCQQIARQHGYKIIKSFYDAQKDIYPFQRSGFSELIKCLNKNDVSSVIIQSFDRLTRDKRVFTQIYKMFKKKNIDLVCPNGWQVILCLPSYKKLI